ncbi:MAG TPA: DHA2 family efflux MFS transporter permease subunit [Solirubrobacteraceae bacterium]|jgi:EmrB/QacA subfamily drug resistance transporter|nr:DHA2 family efflux MFS transporter permease subunit [Solirubrobacteraceae bacterium]
MSTAATVPAAPIVARPRVGVIFAGLMLVLLLAALDQTIVATALPTIVGDLGGLSRLSWVTSAFLLAQTAATPLYGKLGDLYGRKRILQSAILLFLAGSALCGQAGGMTELIAFRAVQGLGAGGLIVLTQSVIGDVVPPRERGRYQGLFGAVFGVASVGGPLLGGVIVQSVSWRWIFYVNLPLGLVALAVLGATLPASGRRGRPVIDYLGAALLAGGLSAIVLVTSLGGTTWAWGSGVVVAVGALGVALIGGFLLVESRAREPVLPLSLLRDRVFAVAGTLSLIVGFALFGSVTFLPLYFQTVDLASPTAAGLRLVPMMVGVLVMSVASGQLIARTGRYRAFPIVGAVLMSIGMVLLSRLTVGTSDVQTAVSLLVLGLGLGSVMQVLVLVVQNAVDYSVLGAATSGVTMMRGIGGSLGTAVFGTIFSTRLADQLHGAFSGTLGAQARHGVRLTGAQVARLPAAERAIYQHAYVHALSPVFAVAAGVAVLGFLLSWWLPQRALRAAPATSTGLEDSMAAPRAPDSLAELERSLTRVTTPEERMRFREQVAQRAGLTLGPGATWALVRIHEHGVAQARALAEQDGVPAARVEEVVAELADRGLLSAGNGEPAHVTAAGRDYTERLIGARCDLLAEALADDDAQRRPEVLGLLRRLAGELCGEPPTHAAVDGGAVMTLSSRAME